MQKKEMDRGPESVTNYRDRFGIAEIDKVTPEHSVFVYHKHVECKSVDGMCGKCKPIRYGKNEEIPPHEFKKVKLERVPFFRELARRERMLFMDFPVGWKPEKAK